VVCFGLLAGCMDGTRFGYLGLITHPLTSALISVLSTHHSMRYAHSSRTTVDLFIWFFGSLLVSHEKNEWDAGGYVCDFDCPVGGS